LYYTASGPGALQYGGRLSFSDAATAQTEQVSFSASATALKQLKGQKSLSLQALIAALESGDARQVESVCRSNRATLLPASGKGKTPAKLWGFKTESCYCPVEVPTKCSDNIDSHCDIFVAPTQIGDKKSLSQKRFTWHSCTELMDNVLASDEIAELCTVLQAGLVPYSMAGDLGEEERKSAGKNGIFTFTLEDPLLSTLPENFDDDAECKSKCGRLCAIRESSRCHSKLCIVVA